MDTTIRLLNISDPLVALIESYREHPYFPSLSANWVPKITVSHTAIRVVLLNRITYQIRKTCRVRFANIKIKFNVYANGDVLFMVLIFLLHKFLPTQLELRFFSNLKMLFLLCE